MREIKFRAWDKDLKEMLTVLAVRDATGNTLMQRTAQPKTVLRNAPTNIEIMQYTGLKDKNGKEIYEGDILAGNWIVVWHEVGFYLHMPKAFSGTLYMPMSTRLESEVIGNIYENPELIK